jgi:hypothetical protein
MIEKTFRTELREHAVRVSRERYAIREEIVKKILQTARNAAEKRGPHPR